MSLTGAESSFKDLLARHSAGRAAANDFVAWVDKILQQTWAEKECDNEALRREILRRDGSAKWFYEECFPVYRLLQTAPDVYGAGSLFEHLRGNQPYDFEVFASQQDQRPSAYIEITQARPVDAEDYRQTDYRSADGEKIEWGRCRQDQEARELAHLEKYGWVSPGHPIRYQYNSYTNTTELAPQNHLEMRAVSDLWQQNYRSIRDAVARKKGKTPPAKTHLVLYHSDIHWSHVVEPEHREDCKALLWGLSIESYITVALVDSFGCDIWFKEQASGSITRWYRPEGPSKTIRRETFCR